MYRSFSLRHNISFVQSTTVSVENKLRLLLLYVFARGSIKEDELKLLEKHAEIPDDKRCIARNLKVKQCCKIYVGLPLFRSQ